MLPWYSFGKTRLTWKQENMEILDKMFLDNNWGIWIIISLKFVPKSPIDNEPSMVQIVAGPERVCVVR